MLQKQNENILSQHSYRLNEHTETLDKHFMSITEVKHGLNSNGDLVNKMATKLERLRENL